ncbi:MAG: phosphatase PAP2 family protein [Lachnospiraceae bacterium]|nr:phosphatase PAP2 family protein [Lachnospiraceae bacterium]
MDFLTNLDGNILLWIQEYLRKDFLNPLIIFITSLGNAGLIWIGASVVLLCILRTRKAGALSILSLLISYLINNLILKNAVARPRPWVDVEGLSILIGKPHDFSFPSGHSSSSFAAAVVMYKMLPARFGIPAVILAAAIALSRLYVGVHYPTDVLFGTLSGIVTAVCVCRFAHRRMG